MSASKGPFGYLDASIWQNDGQHELENFYVRGREMSETQWEWNNAAAAPL